MNKRKRKNIIMLTTFLLVVLVVIVFVLTHNVGKIESNDENKSLKNNRCVKDICLSKVEVEEIDGSKIASITVKNEGEETVNNSCVSVFYGEMRVEFCFDKLSSNDERILVLNTNDGFGDNIKDYKIGNLEKKQEENSAASIQNEIVTE